MGPPSPPPHSSGSAPLVTEVTYCIRPLEEGYGVSVCAPPILIQAQPRPPSPLQPLGSLAAPRPLLIPQSHQARFLEDAISTTSTHRAGALCSSRTRHVIDLVHRFAHLLPRLHAPSMAAPRLASPRSAPKQTFPTLQTAQGTHLSTLSKHPHAAHFPALAMPPTEWGSEER